jgi:hypothetical protein
MLFGDGDGSVEEEDDELVAAAACPFKLDDVLERLSDTSRQLLVVGAPASHDGCVKVHVKWHGLHAVPYFEWIPVGQVRRVLEPAGGSTRNMRSTAGPGR